MSDVIISAEKLGKRYRIGQRERYLALRDILARAVSAPFRWLGGKHRAPGVNGGFFPSRVSPPTAHEPYIWALKDVSFEIKQGEVVGIIGRNGAGKSTLLKILSRITKPTEGYADIDGRVGSLLEVGTGFHPELTGRENIYLNGAILGMGRTEIREKFDEIVAFSEVEKFVDTPVKHYSSGMYVRLAFAVAAHLEPEILMVDEVLAVGDAGFQKKCLGKMGDVAKQGRTVLFVSHTMNAVEQLCTRAILLEQGRIVDMNADVRAVISKYLLGENSEVLAPSIWVNSNGKFSNPWFEPLRFFVCDPQGHELSMPVSNDSDMCLQIEAEITIVDPALTIGYAIYNEKGTLLYWSYQTDQEEINWPKLMRGRNVLRGKIPKRFLNEGAYRIELIGGLHWREWLFPPGENVPSVYLSIQGGLSDSPYWMAKRPGELAPVVDWVRVNSET